MPGTKCAFFQICQKYVALEGVMSYRIVEGYAYPSHKGAIGAISVLLIFVALIVLFYFTGMYVGTLIGVK
jgi:hypothetical protein